MRLQSADPAPSTSKVLGRTIAFVLFNTCVPRNVEQKRGRLLVRCQNKKFKLQVQTQKITRAKNTQRKNGKKEPDMRAQESNRDLLVR